MTIAFDADAEENPSVEAAENSLLCVLQTRGATVRIFLWPKKIPPGVRGIDDLLASVGPDRVIDLIAKSKKRKPPAHVDTGDWRRRPHAA